MNVQFSDVMNIHILQHALSYWAQLIANLTLNIYKAEDFITNINKIWDNVINSVINIIEENDV